MDPTDVELIARVSYLSDWREATPDDWDALPEDEANGYREGATAVLAALAAAGWRPTAGDNAQALDSDVVDYLEQVIYARLKMGEGVRGAARSVATGLAAAGRLLPPDAATYDRCGGAAHTDDCRTEPEETT